MKITPNFIGIGAQKCATTWLYDLLKLHPSVGLSSVKEVHFFSQYYEYGFQWYESHFHECSPNAATIGEFSTSYFSDLAAPIRISQAYPDAKLILMLRDPIERLISNHKHETKIGHMQGPDYSVEAGIKNNPSYIQQGMYADHLKRWLKYFGRDQIHIIIFDDVVSNPELVERDLYRFLELDPMQNHSLLSKSNPSYLHKSRAVERLRRTTLAVFKRFGIESSYRNMARKFGLQQAYRKMNRSASEQLIPPLRSETREYLQSVFAEQIFELEEMTGINVESWKGAQ